MTKHENFPISRLARTEAHNLHSLLVLLEPEPVLVPALELELELVLVPVPVPAHAPVLVRALEPEPELVPWLAQLVYTSQRLDGHTCLAVHEHKPAVVGAAAVAGAHGGEDNYKEAAASNR